MSADFTPSSETDVQGELAALRQEIGELRKQVVSLQEVQLVANREELGRRSVIGLRRIGTLMYYLTLPLAALAALGRRFTPARLRQGYWLSYYAFGFTRAYLRGQEPRRWNRVARFLPTFRAVRARLRQHPH